MCGGGLKGKCIIKQLKWLNKFWTQRVHADFQAQVALALGSDFAQSFFHTRVKNGLLPRDPWVWLRSLHMGVERGLYLVRAALGINQLCWFKAAAATTTGNSWGPTPPPCAAWGSRAPCSPQCLSLTVGPRARWLKLQVEQVPSVTLSVPTLAYLVNI